MSPENQPVKSSWNTTQWGLISFALILVAVIAYTFLQGNSAKPPATVGSASRNAAVGARPPSAPPIMSEDVMQGSINLLDGKNTKLADYSGKVLVVDLWATWCGPCVQEIPHLMEIAREYKSRGVEVIGLTREDPENTPEIVKQFSKELKINYPIGWVDEEM